MNGKVRIERMYAYIVLDDDGTEGIPAVTAPNGLVLPMVGADMERMNQLRPQAEKAANDLKKPVFFCCFENRREIEVIRPSTESKPS